MQIKQGMEGKWQEAVDNNRDAYGSAVIRYAERWADMMEQEVAKHDHAPSETINACAEQTSHDADTEGITGFMYGCAVMMLSVAWVHGEHLRKWHNGQYDYEGDGVVNPAILTVG